MSMQHAEIMDMTAHRTLMVSWTVAGLQIEVPQRLQAIASVADCKQRLLSKAVMSMLQLHCRCWSCGFRFFCFAANSHGSLSSMRHCASEFKPQPFQRFPAP